MILGSSNLRLTTNCQLSFDNLRTNQFSCPNSLQADEGYRRFPAKLTDSLLELLIKDNHSIHTIMTTVNTKGLMLGLLAIGGLLAGGALLNGQAYAQLIGASNTAVAANSDDDVVTQVNSAEIKQESETKCEAKVSDDDLVQVGDNANVAANDCDTTQTATVAQANVNEDNDVQVAEATACQAIALGLGLNLCDITVEADVLNGIPE